MIRGGAALRLERFFANLQKDLKLFLFLLFVICFYRAYFMAYVGGNGADHFDGGCASGLVAGVSP